MFGHWGSTFSKGYWYVPFGMFKMVQRCVLGLFNLVYHPNDSFIYMQKCKNNMKCNKNGQKGGIFVRIVQSKQSKYALGNILYK